MSAGCAATPNIVPQLPAFGAVNSPAPVGQDIALANNFLNSGRKREAADAYFRAAQNYPSPERERLILQAAELSSAFKDLNLTQQYLSPLNFNQLTSENQSRFRLVQAQLALNDRNYREALRILPQRTNNLPTDLGQKILDTRMSAVQASGDKLSLVQELVLQEPSLKQDHLVKLNQDRIWNHARQIPTFQLEQAKSKINHPILKNWLDLAQLSRVAQNGPANQRQALRGNLARWIQNNPNHPGMPKALGLLNASPTTTVTPYNAGQKPVIKKYVAPVARRPVAKAPVVKPVAVKPVINRPIVRKPVVRKPVVKAPTPAVAKKPVVAQPAVKPKENISNIKSLYNSMKTKIK